MQIQSTTSFNFGARFYPYPNTTNSKVCEMFEEKTTDFSKYILRQDDISYFKNDYFQLIDKEKSKDNVYWHCYDEEKLTFEEAELKFYEEHFLRYPTFHQLDKT